jgi:hypothetical protein
MVTAARKLGISACRLEPALSQALQKSRSGLGFCARARSLVSGRQAGKFSDWSSCDPLQVQLPATPVQRFAITGQLAAVFNAQSAAVFRSPRLQENLPV